MLITPLDPDIVTARLRPPPLAELAHRATRRNRRRRVTGGAAVVAVLIAAAVFAGTPGSHRQDDSATTDPPVLHTDPVVLNRTTVLWVGQTGCGVTVRRTIDSGRTWTPPGGPPPLDNCVPGVSPMPAISYTVIGIDWYWFRIADTTWYSSDAGRTWTTPPAETRVVDRFASGPFGPVPGCVSGCDRPRQVDPATGGLMVLSTDLPFPRLTTAVWADANTIWAIGAPDPGADQPLKATHSEDLGRTWSPPVDLPVVDQQPTLVATGPRRAYLLSRPQNGAGARLHRTDDGGFTWVEIDLPTTTVTGLAENHRGRLILSTQTSGQVAAWYSTDAGTTFTGPVPVDVPDPERGGVGAGLVWAAGSDDVVYVNDEGTTWHAITPPS
jgi:hypothetical protein